MVFSIKFFSFLILLVILVKFGSLALERRLLYHSDSTRVSPSEVGLRNVYEKEITAADGTKILTWWANAQPKKYTLLYFHGNGGSLSSRSERIQDFMGKGYGIVMMTYRGYSGTDGTPSEKSNISDARIVFNSLREAGIPENQIILYGESLGTGIALQIAAEKNIAGLILDAPYTSMVDLAELHYPQLPSRLLMRDRYENLKFAKKISVPLLVVHGEADEVVPVEMGNEIASAVKGPSKILTFPGAGHSDHYQFGSFNKIIEWLQNLSYF
ncbi:MAG: alpha/beta hydrolase [Hyphomicrobium sp.]